VARILLVSPAFHGYWRSVASALGRRGHQVVPHVYDAFESTRSKLRNKVRYEMAERVRLRGHERMVADLTARAIVAARQIRPDVVVVVKGDVLGEDFWDALERPRVPRVVWLYDELRRMSYSEQALGRLGPLVSYSMRDTAVLAERGLDIHYLPVAFDHTLAVPASPRHADQVVFVGARYGQRESRLLALREAGIPVLAVGRDWSHHPYDRLRTWTWRRPDLPNSRDVALSEAFSLQARAAAALNVHENQDGFTMRTFEIPGVGGVQLIDRPDVESMYEPGSEVIVFTTDEELVDGAQRARRDRAWADQIRERGRIRTLAEHTFDHRVRVLESLWG
jgi:spore maturation protein CgeB